MPIKWDVSDAERRTIGKIGDRAIRNIPGLTKAEIAKSVTKTEIVMSITACHANGCPLDLDGLLAADDFSFTHDVTGIHARISHRTGRLTGLFLPRFAARTQGIRS